jgi:hypothetical protein
MLPSHVRLYRYVGPAEILRAAAGQPRGLPIHDRSGLVEWLASEGEAWATYAVDGEGTLLVAPRRSEHVGCAGGEPVRAAGELRAARDGEIEEISNLSTGYCPEVASWEAARAALDRAGIPHPGAFTFSVEFRRCDRCGERNVVKDDHFYCSVCDAPLSAGWNFND